MYTLHVIVRQSIEVIRETYPGYPAGQGVASPEEEKSQRSGCVRFDYRTHLLQCSACQSVWYCSVDCQAIKELSERGFPKEKGLGDTQDDNVHASHITPRQPERIAKLVGRKCSVQCYLNDKPLEVLWNAGARVPIVSEGFLKSQLSSIQIRDIEQLLGSNGSISLQAANGTDIPCSGWAEIGVRLSNENEAEMMKGFHQSRNSDMQALISIIRATNSDELCLVKAIKKPYIIPAGQTVRPPCRANSGPIHRKEPVIFEPDELAT